MWITSQLKYREIPVPSASVASTSGSPPHRADLHLCHLCESDHVKNRRPSLWNTPSAVEQQSREVCTRSTWTSSTASYLCRDTGTDGHRIDSPLNEPHEIGVRYLARGIQLSAVSFRTSMGDLLSLSWKARHDRLPPLPRRTGRSTGTLGRGSNEIRGDTSHELTQFVLWIDVKCCGPRVPADTTHECSREFHSSTREFRTVLPNRQSTLTNQRNVACNGGSFQHLDHLVLSQRWLDPVAHWPENDPTPPRVLEEVPVPPLPRTQPTEPTITAEQ